MCCGGISVHILTGFDERGAERHNLIVLVEGNVGNSIGDGNTVLKATLNPFR